jgi:hypothetical protein
VGQEWNRKSFAADRMSRWLPTLVIVILTILTVYVQTRLMFGDSSFTIQGEQYNRHVIVLEGKALSPVQYRVLSEWVAEIFIRSFSLFFPQEQAIIYGFLLLRLLQNALIFMLAYSLYQKLGFSKWLALLGVFALAGSIFNANYDSDLAVHTYFDITFYLIAMLLILDKRYPLVIPLMLFAALNRETSGMIPVLVAVSIYDEARFASLKKYIPAVIALILWILVFLGLRLAYPDRPIFIAYGHAPGVSMWLYNLDRNVTWEQLFRTLGLIPLVGIFFYSKWPRLLQWTFIVMVPFWFAIHFVEGVAAETRLFLVPQAVILIPIFLVLLKSFTDKDVTFIADIQTK